MKTRINFNALPALVTKKMLLFLFCITSTHLLFAQKGRVIDGNNEPIIGMIVALKNVDSTFVKAVTTDLDGGFDLKSDIRPYLLDFQHISYLPKNLISEADDLGDILLTDKSYEFGEIVVRPEDMKQFETHKNYWLSEKDLNKYVDFLHALNEIPLLSVDMNNKLSYMGMSAVKILLNGVNSTENELSTLNPQDIAKIEVYDTPPARFAAMGLTSVVNIVTKKNITGGSVGVNLQDAFHPVYGNNSIGINYNYGNSRWSFNYDNTVRRNKEVQLSQDLVYNFQGEEYSKTKEGIVSPFDWDVNSFQSGYMNQKQDSYQFNITGGFEVQRRMEKNDQYVTYSNKLKFLSRNLEDNNYKKYTLDVYYNKIINDRSDFLLNLTGTCYDNELLSNYYEVNQDSGSTYFDSYSNISGKKPSLIADMRYSHSMKTGTLSFGVRDYLQHNSQDIETGGSTETDISSLSNQVYSYGEFSGQIKDKFYYRTSLGMEHSYFKKEGINSFSSFYFNPRIRLTYMIKKNLQIFTIYGLNTTTPSISMLSETPVWLDNKYVFRGNSNLKPYRTHSFLAGSYYNISQFTFTMNLSYNNSPDAVLPYFKNGNDAVLQTYDNMNKSEQYQGVAVVSCYPFKSKVLLLKLTGMLTKYKVDGIDFNWTHNSGRLISNIQLNWEKFGVDLFYQTSSKAITGQLLRKLPAAAYGEFHYRPTKGMTMGIGWRYPFFDAYKEGTETHPAALVHSISTTSTKDYANMVYFRFSYNFSFGRNTKTSQKKINNEDTDSGILSR
jgi:hypothetical protein